MTRLFIAGIVYSIALILHSCANIAPPSGGPKDNKRPKVVRTFPTNNSTNFRGKKIVYQFDEWVDENKLKEQIIITPRVDNYETLVNKNTLTIKFDTAALKKNTTYYVNLREGIKDLTEGNKTDSTTLVFSTGKYIDSIEVRGNVKKALDNTTEVDNTVMLYYTSDTFNFEKSNAAYQTKTEKNGDFVISNVKPGKYYLYAIKDENNNGKYEANKEYIAYLNDKVDLNISLSNTYLNLVKEDHENVKLKYIEKKKKAVTELEFNKEITSLSVKQLRGNSINVFPYISGKKVKLYTSKADSDSITLELETQDDLKNNGKDTINIVFNYADTSKYTTTSTPANNTELEPDQQIEIQVSKPFKSFKANIHLKVNKVEYKNDEVYKVASIIEKKDFGIISISPKTVWTDTLKILIYPTSFEPVSGYFRDTIKLKFVPKSLDKYGSIGGKVDCATNNLIVELTNKEGKTLKQKVGKKEFIFNYLTDGEYKIRVIEDINGNKKWDQGDYRNRTMLEPIHHFPDLIKLKSNWEILDVKISF